MEEGFCNGARPPNRGGVWEGQGLNGKLECETGVTRLPERGHEGELGEKAMEDVSLRLGWVRHGAAMAQQGRQSRSRMACTAENKGKLAPSGTFCCSRTLTKMTREEG